MLRTDRPWLERALAAVSEGFCPNHGVQLTPLGFCFACEAAYSLAGRGTTVTVTYWPARRP
jgi:hypothetical protein